MNTRETARNKERLLQTVFWSCLLLIFLVFSTIVTEKKQNFREDEIFSYGSANHQGYPLMDIEDGVRYEKGSTPFEDYVFVSEEGRFDYKNVWRNQGIDVHPPLYYMILHTICSLFPGTFSVWYTAAINIAFSIGMLPLLFGIGVGLSGSRKKAAALCTVFVLTAGIYQANTFARMYTMAMFFVTALTWLHVKWYEARRLTWRFYAGLIVIVTAGTLTHYYFLIYLVFLGCYFAAYLLKKKRIRELFAYVLSGLSAGILCILLFPQMEDQIFKGYRGEQSFKNLTAFGGYAEALREMWGFLNTQLFGGLGILVLLCLAVLTFLTIYKCGQDKKNIFGKLGVLLFPSVCYFFIVSKIEVYVTDRYIFPIYGVVLAAGYLLVFCAGERIERKGLGTALAALFCITALSAGLYKCTWPYSYRDKGSMNALKAAEEYGGRECLYVYKHGWVWACQTSYLEVRNYKSLTFIDEENLQVIVENGYHKYDDMVVYILNECDQDKILKEIVAMCPGIQEYRPIGTFYYTTAFYLE